MMTETKTFIYIKTDLKTKTTRDLTPFIGIKAGLLDTNNRFPHMILATLNLKNRHRFDVYRIRLDSGAVELDTENPGNVAEWIPDNNMFIKGRMVFLPDGRYELQVRRNRSSEWKRLISWGARETFGKPVWVFS